MIAAFFGQLDLQEAVVSGYYSLEKHYQDLKLQIDRPQVELQSYVEIAPRFAAHVQERYPSLYTDHQNLIKRSRDFQT